MRLRTVIVLLAVNVLGCSSDEGARPAVDSAEWTEHWDCGYDFEASNTDGTQRLVIRSLDRSAAVAGTVELPSLDWSVAVELGEHFGARGWSEDHACTDLPDADDPEERVDETWEVVEGTLTIGPPEPIVEWPGTARVSAEGLVAETPDGERVPLDPITVRSDCWGCFAG
jgi:hypothetical protein